MRHATADDRPFLEQLFSATTRSEFASIDPDLVDELLAHQHEIRLRAYADAFDPTGDHIIVHDDGPVGRIWVDSSSDEWTLVDFAVLPDHQKQGIGSVLMADLVDQAERSEATVRLTVRSDNIGAQRLYFRNGFTVELADDVHLQFVRRSSAQRRERFEQVRTRVLADVSLQERLRTVPADRLVAEIIEVAGVLGLEIDAEDVAEAQRTARTDWLERWV
ncbi:GNAT family N-acetyltransferase [Ilumatobacter sp.]|uniref:GNAT family N-acetyltransferase n=1 Tax=Ilumatobacter sp. TaxID=1967498 RepID=UPI0032988D6A